MKRGAAAVALALMAAAAPVGAAAPEAAPLRSFTVVAAGDITTQQSIWEAADSHAPGRGNYDFSPLLAPVEPWISGADLALCHLEVPLSPDNSHIAAEPRFSAPHELASGIAATGYDACSTASNHALDQGFSGLVGTLDVLDAAGVGHAGTHRSAEEDHPALLSANGVTVGFASYTIGTNGHRVAESFAVNYLRADEILADAAWARGRGAEFVIISLHWGLEYQTSPAWHQVEAARLLMASPDVDLIIGHHVHVVQPIDVIEGKYVIYGMSNQLSNIRGDQRPDKTGAEDGVIVHLDVVEQSDGSFRVTDLAVTPTWVHPISKQVLPIDHTLATGPGNIEAHLRVSLARTMARLAVLGFQPRPTPTPWPELTCRGAMATIVGTPGDDVLVGTDGDDVIVARGGDDAVWAGDGDDLVCLGGGDDFANGGAGSDHIRAGDGNDLVLGGAGDDTVWGDDGDDLLSGYGGDDLFVGGRGDDVLRGGSGDDVLWGGEGEDRASGGEGRDECRGVAVRDTCEA